jgi:hypothetical protein
MYQMFTVYSVMTKQQKWSSYGVSENKQTKDRKLRHQATLHKKIGQIKDEHVLCMGDNRILL